MSEENQEHTYSVKELVAEIQRALKDYFPDEIWVEGMIQGYTTAPSGHTYFNLVEKTEEPGAIPEYVVPVTLFKLEKEKIATTLKMENGLEVRVRGKATLYQRRGNFQIIMSGIDENYTISKLAENKELLLAKLKQEGLLDANKARPVNMLPLKIALITSKESAARNDFEDELRKSGFGWQVTLIHSSVQGEAASAEICNALKTAGKLPVDVVALVRGGGDAIDLSAFDDERVVRAIAKMKLPVFCGIGHEINFSIADAAAHTSEKTPTACARHLIDLVVIARNNASDLAQNVLDETKLLLQNQKSNLNQIAYQIARAPTAQLKEASNSLSSFRTQLALHSAHYFANARKDLATLSQKLIDESQKSLKSRKRYLNSLDKQIQALDPKKFLQKGWSITSTEDGKVVKNPKDISPDTILITQVYRGEIKSKTFKE